ncbi:MAG: hypothetical protein EOO05_05975 [Chitinophagaceae bacterium]|nr:MAG: hypothetical protein EOO05_05975 [Chitinophagaceae bacterium]
MAFITMGLSNLPCNDCSSEQPESSAVAGIDNTCAGRDHDAHEDLCSPFCHCSCCAGSSISQVHFIESTAGVRTKPVFVSFLPASISEVSLPVWQPPQVIS